MSNSGYFLVKKEQKEIKFDSLSKPSSENSDEKKEAASSTGHELLERQEEDVVDNNKLGNMKSESIVIAEQRTAKNLYAGPAHSVCRTLGIDFTRSIEEEYEPTVSQPKELEEQPRLGQSEVADDDDEGFKTPTSSDHKIPMVCPSAPKKRRPQTSIKRKVSSETRRSLRLDLLKEVESMFPLSSQDDDINPKLKKARLNDAE